MFNYVVNAKYIKDYRIWIIFNDGRKGEIDFEKKLQVKNGVFEPLQDVLYFRNFKIANDTLSWENGADFAPEFLYDLVTNQNS
jgi:hypothetical protein